MISVKEAFQKFRTRLELTEREQIDASRRQKDIRAYMDECFEINRDFLTGSYKRWTKTKPLKDVDIFFVLGNGERPYRSKRPIELLNAVECKLVEKYGRGNVTPHHRSVAVEFDVVGEAERILSFDVVPAYDKDHHYEIPDTQSASGWTDTDPEVHAEKATAANAAYGGEWKGMVRMIKRWNVEKGKSVRPSFLLEVMALDLLRPPFGGDYPYEFESFFASAAARIHDDWPDPAGLGPPVSDTMSTSDQDKAETALQNASDFVRQAINLSRAGHDGEALQTYRRLFGELFPLS